MNTATALVQDTAQENLLYG